MKRICIILTTFALVLTMTQCKKNEGTNQNEIVTITLDVKGNNGSKVDVNTITGTVDFEIGDKVYVGSGGKYVGFLTHNGTNFVGNITNPTENQPLHFYFLGNVAPTETLSAGTTEECSVIISDQTERLPVISYAASFENYVSGVTSYTSHLLNKCALVKFNVTTPSNSPICITGMKNKVTVDFTQNTVIPSIDGEGVIMLSAGSGENVEKWAILLPQETLQEGNIGSVYSMDEIQYLGTQPLIPAIIENGYLAEGINITVNTSSAPIGSIKGLFSVSSTQKVYFSKGNLKYQASTNIWRFAENQWDYIGEDNAHISQTYSGWIDLFSWGTSGYNHGASCYQPWSTSGDYYHYYAYGWWQYNLNDQTGQADWGYNPISNGGNTENKWRTLTNDEWSFVFNNRNSVSGMRFAKAIVNGVKGAILFPDNWDNNIFSINNPNISNASFESNNISSSQWTIIEDNGGIFLPAAGYRSTTILYGLGNVGTYWSATSYHEDSDDKDLVYSYGFSNSTLNCDFRNRSHGFSVRLVQDYNP